MPFRAETVRGYLEGVHDDYAREVSNTYPGIIDAGRAVDIASRYRYNQGFESLNAMVPTVIMILLMFIPAILMAMGVVREQELGSITNLYVTTVYRAEEHTYGPQSII